VDEPGCPETGARNGRGDLSAAEAWGLALDAVPGAAFHAVTDGTAWLRIEDGRIAEHWANRDDLGTARQLGWIPPTPAYLLKMARAKRRAKRH